MRFGLCVAALLIAVVTARAGTTIGALAQQPTPQVQEFVPVSQLPPEEQLPAARLLVTAYAFVWVTILAYLWSIWRRLGKVERELGDVAARVSETRR